MIAFQKMLFQVFGRLLYETNRRPVEETISVLLMLALPAKEFKKVSFV